MERVHLRALKLVGFKSFPDEEGFTFPGNICAIIGPNGCGKSNIVDAMLWVLGEQSTSLLRLKTMGDLVFSGGAGRAPAGAAEVRLSLQCDDGRWADTGGVLEISRRVFRTGPSDYRLNGRTARLRDVMDELLAVGLGTRDYAIIEQGRVGQVLSARPTDRRVLLEEAAGITRYKARRREAEIKLEQTRQNLLRLEDVISEVERTLRQLKRQARQAERYQRLQDQLKDRLRDLFTAEAHGLDQQRQEIRRRRAQIQNEVAAAAAALASTEAELGEARRDHDRTRSELEAARTEVGTLLASRERLEAFLERSADLLDNLRSSLDKARQDRAATLSSRDTLDTHTAEAASRLDSLVAASNEVAAQVAQHAQAEASAHQELEAAEQAGGQLRQDLLRAISTLTASRNRLGNLEREQDRVAYTLAQLEQERERLGRRRAETRQHYEAASVASQRAAAAVESLEEQRRHASAERAKVQEEVVAAKHEAESLTHSLWELRHALAGVERELARHAGVVEQLASLLPEGVLVGQVSHFLHPEPGMADALDRAWAEWLELPVVRDADLTPEQLEELSHLEGRIRLAIAAEAPPPTPFPQIEGAEALFERAGVAAEHLPWLARVLPPAFLCSDPDRARSLAEDHPQALFLDPSGTIWRGRTVEPPTAQARLRGTLVLRDEKARLSNEVAEIDGRVETSSERHRQLSQRLEQLDERLAETSHELVEAEQERARATAVEESLGQEVGRIERELEALGGEEQRNRKLKGELVSRHTELERDVARLEARNLEIERQVEDAATRVSALRDEAAAALRRLDRWRAEERLAGERVTSARAEVERLAEERGTVEARLETLEAEIERLASELAETEDEVVRSRTRLAEEQGLLASGRERERGLADSVEQRAARLGELEAEVTSRRQQHDQIREQLHAVEVEQTRAEGEWERLRDAVVAELATTPEQLLEGEAPEGALQDELRAAVETIHGQIERIGPVNLLAVKEAQELDERATFLREQRQDLIDSLRSLEKTVREIDVTCSERFVDTFERVNVMFTETFGRLFGGGTARLELVDEDNPLESGIDITAQPPGKKTQLLQLLSGGEKALTALALLIALFRIKPAPFCILDEVDAPLDDANVERLAELIQAMTEHTQFILITHNRRTMAHAEALYGVTMEQAGISKVVSVRLEE